jgi:hypothetical protein
MIKTVVKKDKPDKKESLDKEEPVKQLLSLTDQAILI